MNTTLKSIVAAAAVVVAGHAAAQVTLYEHDGFQGRSVTANDRVGNLDRLGFNDRASSLIVRGGRWEVCSDARFEGRCVVLRRGDYPSLREMGLNDAISSVRPVDNRYTRAEPAPVAPPVVQGAYDYRARQGEDMYDVPVSQVRGIAGPPSQRCWVERQQYEQPQQQSNGNLGGALIGGLVGGILGHQVGGGTGRDIATAGGAVAGAVVGSNVAGSNYNNGQVVGARDVQRCENVANAAPEYYDVTYYFNGTEHHVQTRSLPGQTIRVNGRGEPRM